MHALACIKGDTSVFGIPPRSVPGEKLAYIRADGCGPGECEISHWEI